MFRNEYYDNFLENNRKLMARLLQCGFELQDFDNLYEFPVKNGTTASIVSINTAIVHGGSASLKFVELSAGTTTAYAQFYTQTVPADGGPSNDIYIRFYLYIANGAIFTGPRIIFEAYDNATRVFYISHTLFTAALAQSIRIYNNAGTTYQEIRVEKEHWYCIEIRSEWIISASKAHLRVDGVDIGSIVYGASTITDSISKFNIGKITNVNASIQITHYFDDIAVNNTTGSSENSWCGEGFIVHLKPNEAGSSSQWALGAGSGANYLQVDETIPDNATTYVKRNSGTPVDSYGLESTSGIPTNRDIKVVAVGARIGATSSTDTERTAKLGIKSSSGGTLLESAVLIWAINGWATNDKNNVGSLYPLISYFDPTGGSTPWSKTTLDTAQAVVTAAVASTTEIRVSTVWVSVEYALNTNTGYITLFH